MLRSGLRRGGGETPKPTVIEDVLTAAKFKATGTTYTAFTGVKATSPAVYAGNTAKNASGAIQLRSSNSTSGIVTTTSGGSATRVSVVWGDGNATGRTIDIYGKSTAYSKASDLYATQDGDQGTQIGSIICGTSTELVIEGDYPYIGIRSKSNALYLDSITITWGDAKTALKTPANLQVNAAKVVSWDAVSGAASYNVKIGTETFTSNTNSYDAAAIVDDYYDVAVVAVPSDKENYRNSAAATLTGVKFGTPTLATPTLKEGVIDGASISVSWSVDERATAGYNCELFKGDVKIGESKTVNAGAVTFTGLDAETEYVVKVNAIAVEGAKAYAASSVATLDVTTKAAGSAAAKTYTLTFASSYNDPNAGSYKNSWKATRDGFTWKMENWNNNNNYNDRWTYVRAGSKSAASVATITTAAMPEAISTVTMTIDKITATNVKTIKLEVLSADEKTVKETITADKEAIAAGKADNCVFKITNPQQGCKYKITVACQKGSSNGFVQVSKVVYTNN